MKRNIARLTILLVILMMFLLTWDFSPRVASQSGRPREGGEAAAGNKSNMENFDIRTNKSEESQLALKLYGQKLSSGQKANAVNMVQAMKNAQAQLSARVPGLKVKWGDVLNVPEVVAADAGKRRSLTAPSTAAREQIVRGFIATNKSLYGLTDEQVSQLKKTSDYANPAGNLAWVDLQQLINGTPVFQGELRAVLNGRGELVRTISELAPGLNYKSLGGKPGIGAAEGVVAAAKSIGVEVNPNVLQSEAAATEAAATTFKRGPFVEDIKVELRYFPLDLGHAVLAWSMVLWQETAAYYVLVDADTGQLLFRKNIVEEQTQPATYSVYNDDSPAPLSPTTALPGSGVQGVGIGRTAFTFISELPTTINLLGWIPDEVNTTTGNNVDAGLDLVAPSGIDPGGRAVGSPFRVFDFSYNPAGTIDLDAGDDPRDVNYRWGAVTNLFFWSNRYHDRLYELGFTEAARNFQQNNFGRGGSGNDRVLAEAQDYSGVNNANFSTPPDGSPGRMQMYLWPNPNPDRDGDLDQEIVIHELTHGTSNRLHSNASGLGANMSRGMGEGWSDFYARALLSDASEDVFGAYAMGGYATYRAAVNYTDNFYYGIRRFPYAVKTAVGPNGQPHNPVTFADIDGSQIDLSDGAFPRGPFGAGRRNGAHAVHNIGEVWSMALLEVRARLINRLGYEAGNQRMLQLVTDGMKFDPANPTLLDGRNSILAADCAGFGGEDEADIWAGFAARGMGVGASVTPANRLPHLVTESFDAPLALGTVTISDASCNANGYAEPGEELTLTIPVNNSYCSTDAANVVASVEGGTSADYGIITAGATISRELNFTVPVEASCGSELKLAVNIDSSLGPITRNYTLRIGQPAVTFSESFDGVTAPGLPEGWTTSARGAQSPWTVGPNGAFSPSVNGSGVNELVSPGIAVTSPNARLTFTNNYNLETSFDGGVLEISIGGSSFSDIAAAGGSFVAGGYSGNLAVPFWNILADRDAWSGNSGGFITTTVNLPASAANQIVQLRWRCGTDSDSTPLGAGWFIDNVSIIEGDQCAPTTCLATSAAAKGLRRGAAGLD